jgi:hypothetical protein
VQQHEPEVQEVQPVVEEPGKIVVECSDHRPCNFVKGKPRSIINLLISEIQLLTMVYILLH